MLGLVVFAALIFTPSRLPEQALPDKQLSMLMQQCAASRSPSEQIASCDRAIGSGRLTKDDLARAHFARAFAYARSHDNEHAIADYAEAIKLKPDYGEAFVLRGLIYMASRDPRHALADF